MSIYKLTFANNAILSCDVVDAFDFEGNCHYEHIKGKLIFALIKADNENDACAMATQLMREVHDRVWGTDFVS